MSAARVIANGGRARLGEGPLWSARENALYWVDILGRRLNRLSLADERVDGWDMPDVIGWAIEREDAPGLVAGIGRSVATLTLDPLTITPLATLPDEPEGNRVNDAKADPAGRIWLGTMPFDCARPTGSLYRLERGKATRVADGYTIANGPAIAPGGDWMLQTDTAQDTIYRYEINTDGSLGERAPFIVFEQGWGHPDGMTFDADGGLWVACWGASCVTRFTPEGKLDRRIALPASQITSCAFAGETLNRMFVTSSGDGVDEREGGRLFEVDPGCRGLPALRYRG